MARLSQSPGGTCVSRSISTCSRAQERRTLAEARRQAISSGRKRDDEAPDAVSPLRRAISAIHRQSTRIGEAGV